MSRVLVCPWIVYYGENVLVPAQPRVFFLKGGRGGRAENAIGYPEPQVRLTRLLLLRASWAAEVPRVELLLPG